MRHKDEAGRGDAENIRTNGFEVIYGHRESQKRRQTTRVKI